MPESAKQDGIEATYKDGILEIRVPKNHLRVLAIFGPLGKRNKFNL
jgi:hypothetical protein